MPILQELLIRGYIECDEKHCGLKKVNCPFCYAEYSLEDGIYNCTNCNKYFRKIGLVTYDADKVANAAADYIIQLLTFCAKSDYKISSKERDYIIDYIHSFGMNDDQESWAFAQYDYARYSDYNNEVLLLLKQSIEQLIDNYDLESNILYDMLTLLLIDNLDFNNNQIDILEDYMTIFKISPTHYEEIMAKVLNNKNKNDNHVIDSDIDSLDEYYKILGVKKGCSENELKKRYAYLTKNYHPDRYSSYKIPNEIKKEFEDMYKKINLAYDKLRENI